MKLPKKGALVAIDTETKSLTDKTMVGFSVAFEDKSEYLPVRDKILPNMPMTKAQNLLKYILENCHVVFHNSSFDLPVIHKFGVEIPDKLDIDDTVIMANLVDENMLHGLKKLTKKYFDYQMTELKELTGSGKNRKSFDEVEDAKKINYAKDDAKYTLKLYYKLKLLLDKDEASKKVYEEIEKPLLSVIAAMHISGISIDVDEVFKIGRLCRSKVESAEDKLKILMGKGVNFNSSKQLREFFIEKENMPILKKSVKTGQSSVDKEVLEKYAKINNTAKILLEYRKYNKILTTFIPALTPTNWKKCGKTGKRKGKIFAAFNQAGTVSGRFSSSRPNMQNIPRDEKDLEIRKAVIPEEGHILIGADYSQIELRVLAHFSQDSNLMGAYNNKKDIHQQTANALGIRRQKAKTINFGLVYGMRNRTLGIQIGVPEDEAQRYIDKYFETYPGIKQFWEDTEKQFRDRGFVQTLSGRKRRHSKHFYHKDDYEQGAEIRSAINSIIQGSAADLIKVAMINMHGDLKRLGAKLVLTVHDEVLVSVPKGQAGKAFHIILDSMHKAGKNLRVPIEVDIKYGRTWAEAHSGEGSLKQIFGNKNAANELGIQEKRAEKRRKIRIEK